MHRSALSLTIAFLVLTRSVPVSAQSASTPPAIAPEPAIAPKPAIAPDPAIAAMLATIAPARLRADDAALVAFGTRDTFSERSTVATRGVYAARAWIAAQFRAAACASGGRMTVAYDTYLQPKLESTPRDVEVSNVIATLRGYDPKRGTIVISSHYDSRPTMVDDVEHDAPGADDDASAVVTVLAAARAFAPHRFPATIVFAAYDGEEQGLWGSGHHARALAQSGGVVEADVNADIIGASVGDRGQAAPSELRLFSEALPIDAKPARIDVLGGENDAPSRELARAVKEAAELYEPAMHVALVYRGDRFLRGGDQESYTALGIPAVRFVEASESFAHQHQDVRVEGGVTYGDRLEYVDFDYLARVAACDLAAVATLALAPPAPAVGVEVKGLTNDTTLTWQPVPGAAGYDVLRRSTSEPLWSSVTPAGDVSTYTATGLSKDDWIFGVRAVDAAGHRGPAGYPVPIR